MKAKPFVPTMMSHLIKNPIGGRFCVKNGVKGADKQGGEATGAAAFSSLENEVLVCSLCLPKRPRDQQLLVVYNQK